MMRRSRLVLLAACAVALAAGVVIGRWWDGRTTVPRSVPAVPTPQPPPGRPAEPPPFLQIEGTSLSGADPRGRRVWDVRAQTLEVDRARRRLTMSAVMGQFYADGTPQLAFRAPSALLDVATRDVELSGGVELRARDGRTLRAARVRYTAADGVLTAMGGVRITQPGMTVTADALRTDARLAESHFTGNVVVRVSGP
jgi:LPS export ABC transporter protein LptC